MKLNLIYLALAILLLGCSESYDGELLFISPEAEDYFEYPYFLFIPNQVSQTNKNFIIVEPNNSGFADDDLQKHVDKAKNTASNDYYLGNYMAKSLSCPLIVPVFPREESKWRIYTHALDRDVMLQKGNPLERLDRQLIEIVRNAQKILLEKNIQTDEQFLLTGFSASGTFANRFTVMHPDQVLAVAAGGLNGLLMLPADSLQHKLLPYPIGTGDLKEISGREFQQRTFQNTPQYYFMGALDDNDALPYDDAFDPSEREQISNLLGEQMLPERWNKCQQIYDSLEVNATIKTYPEVGHEHPEEIKLEILQFFRASIQAKHRITDAAGRQWPHTRPGQSPLQHRCFCSSSSLGVNLPHRPSHVQNPRPVS